MTQPAPRAAVSPPAGVLTVADLLSRCGPPVPGPRPAAGVPAAAPRPRANRPSGTRPSGTPGGAACEVVRYDRHQEERAPRRGRTASAVERSAVAAGVLLVAGSVVGAAVATTDAPAAGTTPLDQRTTERAGLAPVPALPVAGPAVATHALDPGTAPDDRWLQVAFPGSTAADRTTATDGRSGAAGDPPPEDRTGERDGGTPPTGGAAGDAGADDPDDGSRDDRPRGNGRGNGNGNGKDDDVRGAGDEDAGAEDG